VKVAKVASQLCHGRDRQGSSPAFQIVENDRVHCASRMFDSLGDLPATY
jgi:hypothetical protein